MPEIELVINNEVGLHARPAAVFVQTASKFKSTITINKGGNSANAKSILHVLTLGIQKGTTITVLAEGEDAAQALEAISDLHSKNFGERE